MTSGSVRCTDITRVAVINTFIHNTSFIWSCRIFQRVVLFKEFKCFIGSGINVLAYFKYVLTIDYDIHVYSLTLPLEEVLSFDMLILLFILSGCMVS